MFEETPGNPIMEYVSERSSELVEDSSMEVFHRMRVVELLMNKEDRLRLREQSDRKELVNVAKNLAEEQTEKSQANKNSGAQQLREEKSIDVLAWEEPYDTSPEVLEDGVDWYLEMQKHVRGSDPLINKRFADLTLNLYRAGNADLPGTRILVDPSTRKFSTFVEDVASYKYQGIKNVSPDQNTTGSDDGNLDGLESVARFQDRSDDASDRFEEGIKSLGNEFDRIYSQEVTRE